MDREQQFGRSLISEPIKDAKRNLRRGWKHQCGSRPFGWQLGPVNGHGRAGQLIPNSEEQSASATRLWHGSPGCRR
jgi:hypothetical protein